MSSLTAMVDPKDMRELESLFARAEKSGRKSLQDLMEMTGRFAAQSAAIATKPRKGRNKAGNIIGGALAKKHRVRPLQKLPASMGFWYVRLDSDRKIPFKSEYKVKTNEMKRRNLKRVSKGVKIWDKQSKGFIFKPYYGTRVDETKKIFRIPHAGLAKESWMRSFKKLGGKSSAKGLRRNRNAGKIYSVKRTPLALTIANLVNYVSKSSPGAARYGLNRAKNRMKGKEKARIENQLKRELAKK